MTAHLPTYHVRWLDAGTVNARRIQARDAQAVAAVLGVPPANILGVTPLSPPRQGRAGARADRFPLRLFSKELSVLLGAGIPLLEAVTTLREKEASSATARALADVEQALRSGDALSVALARRAEAFDTLFVAVVSSAERTGQLQQALRAHAQYLAWVEALRDRLLGASIYPLMLLATGGAVTLFLLIYVVPRFAGLIDGVQGEVPAASRALLALGQWTGGHPWLATSVLVLLLALPWAAWQHPGARARLIAALWAVPGLGERLRLLALARLYRTLGMLLDAGVPALSAMRTARAVTAPRLVPALERASARVERGERLSQALQLERLDTPVAQRMLRVGERSGAVGPMLGEAAAFYDEELARLTDLLTRVLNPLLMLIMGGVIGTVVVLMYLPIFQLMESVQ
jgi:general secretion pathway protein F